MIATVAPARLTLSTSATVSAGIDRGRGLVLGIGERRRRRRDDRRIVDRGDVMVVLAARCSCAVVDDERDRAAPACSDRRCC